jgi:hypothetical protein
MSSFLALITPIDGGLHPSHPIAPGGQPPGIWPSPGHPSHPIAPGGQPPGIWGGAPSYPDIGGPPPQPGIWPSPGHPSHPIAPGGQPPGIWPSPGHPSHPIAPGGQPPGIWGGGNEPFPTPPIFIGPPAEQPADRPIEWHSAWSPQTGWIVVGVPTVPVPTPSASPDSAAKQQ